MTTERKGKGEGEGMTLELLIVGVVVAVGFALWVVGSFSPEAMLENALPEAMKDPLLFSQQQAEIAAVVVEKPVGLGLGPIEIKPGTYLQGLARDGQELDIFGWEEIVGILHYDTYVGSRVVDDIPEHELCELANCAQEWQVIEMTAAAIVFTTVPMPTATPGLAAMPESTVTPERTVTPVPKVALDEPASVSESTPVVKNGVSVPTSASGAGFFFLVFLAFLGLKNFFKLLGRGKKTGTKILVRRLEKKRK